jgi:hypothetical protein
MCDNGFMGIPQIGRLQRLRFFNFHRLTATFECYRFLLCCEALLFQTFHTGRVSRESAPQNPHLVAASNERLVLFGTAACERDYLPDWSRVIWIAVALQPGLAALAVRVDMKDIAPDTPVARPEASFAMVDSTRVCPRWPTC